MKFFHLSVRVTNEKPGAFVCPFDKSIKSLYFRSFVVSVLFARFHFKVIRKSLYHISSSLVSCVVLRPARLEYCKYNLPDQALHQQRSPTCSEDHIILKPKKHLHIKYKPLISRRKFTIPQILLKNISRVSERLEEKFRISARPCNILYLLTLSLPEYLIEFSKVTPTFDSAHEIL